MYFRPSHGMSSHVPFQHPYILKTLSSFFHLLLSSSGSSTLRYQGGLLGPLSSMCYFGAYQNESNNRMLVADIPLHDAQAICWPLCRGLFPPITHILRQTTRIDQVHSCLGILGTSYTFPSTAFGHLTRLNCTIQIFPMVSAICRSTLEVL